MDIIQYGVLRLGQIWTVTDNSASRMELPAPDAGIVAVRALVDTLSLSTVANDNAWDVLLDPAQLRRPAQHERIAPSNDV